MGNKNNTLHSLILGKNNKHKGYEEFTDMKINKNYLNKFKEKTKNHKIVRHHIIRHILGIRKEAIRKILKFFQNFSIIIKLKKKMIIQRILSERDRYCRVLQNYMRTYMIRSLVKKILEKQKEYFTIVCNIKNSKNVSLDVFMNDGTKTNLKFEYCKIRKIYVLYILRKIARGCCFRVNFLSDEKVVIDPMYRTDYDDQGNFFNIIDFEKIEDDELRREEDHRRIIRYYISQMNRQRELERLYLRRSSEQHISSSDDGSSDEKQSLEKTQNNKSENFKSRNTLKRNTVAHIKNGANLMSRSLHNFKNHQIRHNLTLNNLISPTIKPILRSPNTSKNNLGHKRVSFNSTVQFSV
jgi:hypothetical protein